MTFLSRFAFGILLAVPLAIGCSGSSNTTTPGTGGSGGSGGTGGGIPFQAVTPCSTESAYATTGNAIAFGGTDGFNYVPKCLKVSAGATVTWTGDFLTHPLGPSTTRGTLTGNPITATTSGATASFTFPTPGFYAYLCMFHGADDGMFMDGVLWVNSAAPARSAGAAIRS